MRATLACVLCVGCAAANVSPDAGGGAPDATGHDDAAPADARPIDAAIGTGSFTDDTAADFGGGTATDTTIDGWGAIEPIAYYTGGWLEHASDTGVFTDGTTATWAQVQGFTPTGKPAISWWSSVNWIGDTPPSVGLTDGDNWTEWYEGDVYLDAGTWTFYLLADDHGFVEVAPQGTTAYQRVVSANWSTEGSGNFVAAGAGWYPIRFAICEQTGNAEFHLQLAGPTLGKQPVPRDRMRARVDDQIGMVEAGFDDSHGVGDVETTIDAVGPGNTNWNTGNPGDLGMTAADLFSVRWTGQLRIDTAGSYSFRDQTDDGQRMWIDGTEYLNTWGDTTVDATTPLVALAAGWHDLVIEQTENGGGAADFVTVASGPAMQGQSLPVTSLRPVEARSERVAPASNHTDIAIADLTTVSSIAPADAPVGSVVTSVDINYELTHTYWGDLVITLVAPSGQSVILRNRDQTGGNTGDLLQRFTTTALNGAQANGPWTLQVQDAAGTDSGTLLDFAVTPHFTGGQPPIPATASYESIVHDLGAGVTTIDALDWTERVPSGSDVAISVRTCAVATDCATAAWSAPVTAPGGTPSVAPAEFLQYKVDLASDGDHAALLDRITVNYHVAQ